MGLGAPYWNSVARAALECTSYQVKDVIELIRKESNIKIKQLKVDGNQFLMQFKADLLDVEVNVSEVKELSAMGSVYLAGLGVGVWKSIEEISQLNPENIPYYPKITETLRNEQYDGWKKTVRSVLSKG